MYTNAHIFKKLGFTTTIQEYFAEHYRRIQKNWISDGILIRADEGKTILDGTDFRVIIPSHCSVILLS